MTKVVGFDLDDTIVPEVLFLRSGIRHVADMLHRRLPLFPEQRIVSGMESAVFTRSNHYSALEALLDEYGMSDSVDMKRIVAEFRNHFPDPSIYHASPSMLQLLTQLRNDPDIRTILITDGRSVTQRNKIAAARLDVFFDDDDIFISEETGHDKTSPDNFLLVMEKYAGASEFHYVGDNPIKDFLHPSRLGWLTHRAHRFPLMIHQGIPR
ncbi:MAG: HAD-IA family hydrolase [Muribaculaceae bacterium]|nr:HAD-IA family hydrolase [Muribaculaceae bacterium]